MAKPKYQKVTVFQNSEGRMFHSDLIISKRHDVSTRKSWNEVLSISLAGHTSELKDFVKGKKIVIEFERDRYSGSEKLLINDMEDYTVEHIKKNEFLKLVITKRVDNIIREDKNEDETNKKTPAYPLIIFNDKNHEEIKEHVYNMVRNGITTPMIPNVKEHLIMAGQLFIDKEEGKDVLRALKGKKTTRKIHKDILSRAQFLMNCYEEWKEYIFEEMKTHKLIKPVDVKHSVSPVRAYEIMVAPDIIETIIQKGVRNGHIRFTKRKRYTNSIKDFNEFMTAFAPSMSLRIDSLAKPIHRYGKIRPDSQHWFEQMKRKPLPPQREAIEACLKSLEMKSKVNLIGECGVGKTLMMIASNWVYNKKKNRAMKLLVFSPDALVKSTWEKELYETLYDIEVHIITSINELRAFEEMGYFNDKKDRAFILSQQVAKSGYSVRPNAVWQALSEKNPYTNKYEYKCHGYVCPTCGKPITQRVKNPSEETDAPKYIQQYVPFDYFSTDTVHNRRCKGSVSRGKGTKIKCNTILWEPMNKQTDKTTKFVYISDTNKSGVSGFFPKDQRQVKKVLNELVKIFNSLSDEKEKDKLQKKIESYRHLEMIIEGKEKEGRKISPYRVSVAEYISKKMKGKFTNLIVDEFHEFQGDSARSNACINLIKSIPIVQTGTGTAMNGYAKSRFKTDYMLFPAKMKEHGYNINDENKYQVSFGVTEKRTRIVKKDGKEKKTTLKPVDKPGISPVIFPLFMQDTSVFISLSDLKANLPALTHLQIEVPMDPALEAAKQELEEQIREVAKHDRKLFRGSIQVNYAFLDSPSIQRELKDQNTKEVVLKTPSVPLHVDNKLQALVDFAKQEVIMENRRIMIYTYYTNDGINTYLRDQLVKEGFKVTILNKQNEQSVLCDGSLKKIKKDQRVENIYKEVENGTEILIVNPELIKTGMNLTDFPTICYYQMGYQLYTNRQADRRAWRIGQEKDCKIVYLYYKDSIQQDIASLMATKIVASQAIEGNMDAAGLEAILNERTAEEVLTQKFFDGIRGKVSLRRYTEDSELSA